MPAWLRGTPLEGVARAFSRKVKRASGEIEKRLRGGKVKTRLPSTNMNLWLDYDFATRIPLPERDDMLAAFIASLEPGNIVYDVGGFVGWYAIAASQRIAPDGHVYSFEPVPETAQWLRRHLEINHAEKKVRVVEAACSHSLGMISMPVWPLGLASGNGLFDVHPRTEISPNYVEVLLLPLDEFWKTSKASPDVIKIDVEGAELWVLEGARELLSHVRPMIFLEIHKFSWHLFETTEKKLRYYLGALSYEILEIYPPHSPITAFADRGLALLKPSELA